MATVRIQLEKYSYTINIQNIQSDPEKNRKVLFAERNLYILDANTSCSSSHGRKTLPQVERFPSECHLFVWRAER